LLKLVAPKAKEVIAIRLAEILDRQNSKSSKLR